ncbi:MAG: zf-HC2 domain-containing protein [Gemmatimonadota bacterium]|nr:zf-HC2 domain-containing protein [Gemmatimonadota bacterium]
MTHDVIRHLLDDYVTGELTEDARAPVGEHIAGCEICSAEAESLKNILARASELPKSVEPPPGSWSSIRQAIEHDAEALKRPSIDAALDGPSTSAAGWRRHLPMAAAAALVAVLSSGATFLYATRDANDTASSSGSARAEAGETPANLAAFTIEENSYMRTASILKELLDSQRDVLAPETVAQLNASLRTIDEAILEARNALARDPANKMLVEMLSASYRQKVDLLRRTTEMTRGS